MLIRAEDSFLLAVDLQEKLVPAVEASERVLANVGRLMTAAARLEVPALATEHCAERIGPMVAGLRGRLSEDAVLAKVHFSAQAEPGCAERFAGLGRATPVITGTEAHVCVMQTALGLKQAGFRPALVTDAVGSRHVHDRETALGRMRDAGITLVTTEMVIFEWLARGDHEAFRDLLPLIKDG
jgi:nicotinamidase-related amidase